MKTEKRIALACFIGAVIGTLLVLQFNHHLWWIGIIIGGIVGYLTYKPVEVWTGLSRALSSVKPPKPDKEKTKECTCDLLRLSLVELTIYIYGIIVFEYICHTPKGWYTAGPVGIFSLVVGIYFMDRSGMYFGGHKDRQIANKWLLWCNPLTLPITTAFLTLKIVWKLLKMGLVLLYKTICLIHSDVRLLCMADAMLGALTGLYFGNALVGGIIGALCGVLNYRLISVKLLKLVKA
jgi:hypothetical protein